MQDLVIIGSGPAGYTAAIYAARARLQPLLLTGPQAGGQLTTTTEVENFPGFPEGITGPDLVSRMEQQAGRFGTDIRLGATVTAVTPLPGGYSVAWEDMIGGGTASGSFRCVIVASGASARKLGIPGEEDFFSGAGTHQGVTACATCDGAMPIYRDQEVCVVGGGDSACEEAMFMTRFASRVHVIHRRDALRASRIMAERTLAHPQIEVHWDCRVVAYLTDGTQRIRGVTLEDTADGSRSELPVKGVFLAIGHRPNTGFLTEAGLDLDAEGFIRTTAGSRTSLPGLLAAGDVRDRDYRQAITAAGMGCMAALEAERYLSGE